MDKTPIPVEQLQKLTSYNVSAILCRLNSER